MSHKIGWGIWWYDWSLLALIFFLHMAQLGALLQSREGQKKMIDTLAQLKDDKKSYFTDLFSKEKDEE